MNAMITTTQRAIIEHAIEHSRGKIEWFPDTINRGLQAGLLNAMLRKELIVRADDAFYVAPGGYQAVGHPWPALPPAKEAPRKHRENSKQAQVIRMLQRPEGATLAQICAETGWQSHTVRGLFASAFKKKLGLNLVSEKTQGGERTYRLA